MKLFKIFKSELKSIYQNKIKLAATAAVIVIPLSYSLFYLKAYWDPYGNLKNYNIAVVNKDRGTSTEGKSYNYGNDIVNNLKDKNDVGFKFVSEEEATKGIANDKYFAEIQIPEDFSQKIVSAKDGKAISPKIIYLSNNKKNYIGTKISDAIKNEFVNEIKKSISGEYGAIAFDSIYEMKDGMKDASNGTEKLYDGTSKLKDGSQSLNTGLKEMDKQVPELQNGVSSLANGSDQLNNGLGQLNSKIPELSAGANKLTSGATTLNKGMNSLQEGAKELTDKSSDLKNAGDSLNENFDSKLISGYTQVSSGLKSGADQLSSGANQVQNGVNSLITTLNQNQYAMSNGQKQLQAYLAAHPEAMQDPNMQAFLSTMQSISDQSTNPDNSKNIEMLKDGVNQVATGASNLSSQLDINNQNSASGMFYSGLNSFKSQGIEPYTTGVNQYANGVYQLSLGINTISQGSSQLASGLENLDSNMPLLQNSSKQLYDGSYQLTKGLGQLNSQVPNLAQGVNQLTEGSGQLSNGLNDLKNGTKELDTGLNNGIKKVEDNVKTPSKDLGNFIGNPVKVDEQNLNPINNYGSGLAPYFLPISIWLGAVFMFLVIKTKKDDYKELSNVQLVLGKFIPYAVIGIIQAVSLGGIVLALGIEPSNTLLLFLLLTLMALSFDSIIHCFMNLFGLVGEGLAVVLLVLQLCSDSGTFPIEVLPKFFQAISPYLPFTYAVEAIREILFASRINYSIIQKDALILVLFGLIAMIVNIIFVRKGEKLSESLEEKLAA